MKTDLNTIRDTFKISYDTYDESRKEAIEVTNMYHNRQYTQDQLNTLANRGQPAETFNVIKMFGRLLVGYYSTVVNTVVVSPVQQADIINASLLNDIVDYTMRDNEMETEGDKMKLDALLSGIMCNYIDIEDTKVKDQFGRTLRKCTISHVPQAELGLDPMSKLEDYSDARYIHRWKWVSEDQLNKLFPKKKDLIKVLTEYENHLNIEEAEFSTQFGGPFDGLFKRFNNYLLVHTIIEDDNGKVYSVYWIGEHELSREEVTHKEVRFPYRVQKIHSSDKAEYYGIFREVIESQKAINQALLKIQLMANTQKVLIEKGGVEDIAEFTRQFNRVNAIIPVKSLSKIKVENLTREVLDQYTIIDKGLDRIQKVLGVNDSFLGMAFASDSGRKVKLQQNATTLSLRYVSGRIEQFYRLMGWDIIRLVKQYYTATQALRIADESVGLRWIELNKPMTMWEGQFDEQGQPIMEVQYEEELDPATGKPMVDEEGNIIIAPIPTEDTEIAFTDVDLSIDSTQYNDEDEKNQLLIETILQGNIGSLLSQVNPSGFFKMSALAIKSMKTKHSIDMGEILTQTAEMLAQTGGSENPEPLSKKESPKSQSLKLPQNTNEGY